MLSTFRFKIGLGLAGVVIVVMIIVYLATVLPLSKKTQQDVLDAVKRASRLVTKSQKLQGFELVSLAESIASNHDFIWGIRVEEEKQRRINIFDAIDQFDKKLIKEGRKAHFFGVVDKEGKIIARDLDIKNMYGEHLPFKSIKQALKGKASHDVWKMKNHMMRAAAAPIWVSGKVEGAVAIAYDITAAEAREERDQFGTHVAYFMNGNIRASSFSLSSDESEDSGRVSALNKALLGTPEAPGSKILAEGRTSEPFELNIHGDTYMAIAGPVPISLTNKVGYVVLASLDQAKAAVSRIRWMFLLLCVVMLLILSGGMIAIARHFVNAEDKLELGVTEIINGNMDYIFEGVEEFEGLANALNVMLARLLGRPEPGEEEDAEAAWRADVVNIDEVSGDAAAEAEVAAQLAAEEEGAYYSRIFKEYIEARKKMGLPNEGITLESLTQKIKANEALLRAKHKCRMVRFVVNDEAGKVSLKPIRIS